MSTQSQFGISIIIPCLNPGRYLTEMIDSINDINIQNSYEIILINDGSTDTITLKIFENLHKYNMDIVIHHLDKTHGTQYARNIGLRMSNFKYVMTCDSDDKFNTDESVLSDGTYMDRSIEFLEEYPEYAFTYGISEMFGDFSGYTISAYSVTAEQILNKHHAQQTCVYRKEDLLNVGYDEEISKWTDWATAVRILNQRYKKNLNNKIKFFPQPFYNYRIHDSTNRMSSRKVSELEIVELTVNNNYEIFSCFFPYLKPFEIAELVTSHKPNRLTDLLYIANENLERALQIAKERGYDVYSETVPESVP